MRELSSERRRFGYRRLHLLLRREGWDVNWKKPYSIYREEWPAAGFERTPRFHLAATRCD